MTAIAPHPTVPGTVYAGAAGGGVWKTTDGGATWTPLTEDLHDLSVGALALAPSNPSIVYLGTGEGGHPSFAIPGIGFVKSLDGGRTWILPTTVLATQFYRISVHPSNPDELVVGTNAGAFRSTDGGATWTNVLSHATYGDVPDLVRDPTDPNTLYATTWCAQVRGCTVQAGRVLKSTDGGSTWTDRSEGLPSNGHGGNYERISIAISRTSSSVLYAGRSVWNPATGAVVSHVYRTADGGSTWSDLASSPSSTTVRSYLGFQSYYDNVIVVSPSSPDVVVAGGVSTIRSTDGGSSFQQIPQNLVHPDCHDLQYQGSTLWIANDGGIWTSEDDGATVVPHNDGLVTRQYYALVSDRSSRTRIVAGSQDNGTVERIAPGTIWRTVNGGDGIQAAIHPGSPALTWTSSQGGQIYRASDGGLATAPHFRSVAPPVDPEEFLPFFTVVRLDPRSGSTIYTGSWRVWKSPDGGDTWAPLPTSVVDGGRWDTSASVTAIALSASSSQALLVAKTNGIFRSDDGGRTWTTGRGIADVKVTSVELDPRDAYRAYATFAAASGPSLYASDDGGRTWTPSAAGLPEFPAQVVRVDPTDSNDLFCGTDVGVFRSTDRGRTWARFGTGLPAASVHDLDIHEDGSIVRVATHGRGIWELAVPATNAPPTATILAPTGSVFATVGSAVDFSGSVADPDAGDAAAGTWFFPDDSTSVPLPPSGSVRHVFRRAGVFPVALTAVDSRGARGAAWISVSVREAADSCSAAALFPASGPFPYTIRVNNQTGTTEASDPSPACFGGGLGNLYSTWFEFTPAAAGTYELSTCGADVVTAVSVYTGPACGPFTAVPSACKATGPTDTDCGSGASGRLVSFDGGTGQTFRILLSSGPGYDGGPVPVTLTKSGTSPGLRVLRVGDSSGPEGGGKTVAITGNGFREGDGLSVAFGGTPATDIVFGSASSLTVRTPPHAPGHVDVAVTLPGGATAVLQNGFRYEDAASALCVPTATSLCLGGGRFRAEAQWRVATQGESGAGNAVALTADTGYFWFFSPSNIELVVKVVDGRPANGRFWVFYGALSDVEYQITVTDLATGEVRVYTNPAGRLASAADTNAF